jgi:uncharacterized protein (DUF983 family)
MRKKIWIPAILIAALSALRVIRAGLVPGANVAK